MCELIVSRELIARQADRAAELHLLGQEVANPYDERLQPEHHMEWGASFTRSVHARQRAAEEESSA